MSKLYELTTKEEITSWTLNLVQQCLFYPSKNKYMIERIKSLEKNYQSLDEYKNKIEEFMKFHNIEYISQTNIKNHQNLDLDKIKNYIQHFKNKVDESKLMDSLTMISSFTGCSHSFQAIENVFFNFLQSSTILALKNAFMLNHYLPTVVS